MMYIWIGIVLIILATLVFTIWWSNSKQLTSHHDISCSKTKPIVLNRNVSSANRYDSDTAKNLFQMCLGATYMQHCPKYEFDHILVKRKVYDLGDCIIVHDNKTCYIIFGENHLHLDVKNLVEPKELMYYRDGALVEPNSYKRYLSVRDKIQDFLFQKKECVQYIFLAGYGHGAMLSTMCALDIPLNCYTVTHYTFGSPRVGNVEFSDTYNSIMRNNASFRVFNTEDAVPTTPSPTHSFQHVGRNVSFTRNMGHQCLNHLDAYYSYMPQ